MATNRHATRHPRRTRLNRAQEMTLLYGPDPRWDAFRTEEEHRDAWLRNRDRLLAWHRHGHRPMAWWHFESPIPFLGYDREQAVLFEAGLLGEEESATLVTEWRREFERAQASDFWVCQGPGRFLHGKEARRAYYRWAGIPRDLLKRWTRERRRRSRTVRELEAASVPRIPRPEQQKEQGWQFGSSPP